MTSGRWIVVGLLLVTALMGAGLWYAQTYAWYDRIEAETPAAELRMTRHDGEVEALVTGAFEGIDAETSPLRYRACFTTDFSPATLTETFAPYALATPLNAPGWFSCFDADAIGAALDDGTALAFLGERNVPYGFDRVVAVFPDGRGFAWPQLNACGEAAFGGDPLPSNCPPAPKRMN